jgi:uncharacterized protein YgiM (DUF1202 family)
LISAAKKLAACFTLAALTGAAFAQTESQYVIEQLVVSVSATADGSGDRIAQIKSGDRVEVLEHEADQSHVRLTSGEEGWVRTSYLSSSPPLREQLKTRTDELEKLRQEKAKLEADLASARKAASAAVTSGAAGNAASLPAAAASASQPNTVPANAAPAAAAAASPTDSNPAETQASYAAAPSNPPLFSSEGMMPSRPSWILALLASVVTLVIGFVLGWRVLDRRIRAKYGGLRIY